MNPSCEGVLQTCVDDVAEPLLGQLFPFSFIGEVLETLLMVEEELRNLLNGERLILRDAKMFNGVCLDHLLDSSHKVLQKAI